MARTSIKKVKYDGRAIISLGYPTTYQTFDSDKYIISKKGRETIMGMIDWLRQDYDENNEKKDEETKYVYRERRCGSMSRSFNVEGIREQDITASFKDGVLTLNLPKVAEAEKPETHAIEIEG